MGWPPASLLEPSCLCADPSLTWTMPASLARLGIIGHISLISLGCHCSLCCTSASNSLRPHSQPHLACACREHTWRWAVGRREAAQQLSGRASSYLPGLHTGWLPLRPPALYLEKDGLWGPELTALSWGLGADRPSHYTLLSSCSGRERFPGLLFPETQRALHVSLGAESPACWVPCTPRRNRPRKAPVLGAAVALCTGPTLAM